MSKKTLSNKSMDPQAEITYLKAMFAKNQKEISILKTALEKYAGSRSLEWRIADNGELAEEALKQVKKIEG